MNLKRLSSIIILLTLLSVLYVCLQIEITKIAYKNQARELAYRKLVDRNTVLSYNIKQLASLDNIDNKILEQKAKYEFPRIFQISSLAMPVERNIVKQSSQQKSSFLARIFNFGTIAEANTTK